MKRPNHPCDCRRIEVGWLLVLFEILSGGVMHGLCRMTGVDTDLGLSCSLFATLLFVWLVLQLIRSEHRNDGCERSLR